MLIPATFSYHPSRQGTISKSNSNHPYQPSAPFASQVDNHARPVQFGMRGKWLASLPLAAVLLSATVPGYAHNTKQKNKPNITSQEAREKEARDTALFISDLAKNRTHRPACEQARLLAENIEKFSIDISQKALLMANLAPHQRFLDSNCTDEKIMNIKSGS